MHRERNKPLPQGWRANPHFHPKWLQLLPCANASTHQSSQIEENKSRSRKQEYFTVILVYSTNVWMDLKKLIQRRPSQVRPLTFGSGKPQVLQDSVLLTEGVKPVFIHTKMQKLFLYLQVNTYLTRLVYSAY